jgi:hypothetical protein
MATRLARVRRVLIFLLPYGVFLVKTFQKIACLVGVLSFSLLSQIFTIVYCLESWILFSRCNLPVWRRYSREQRLHRWLSISKRKLRAARLYLPDLFLPSFHYITERIIFPFSLSAWQPFFCTLRRASCGSRHKVLSVGLNFRPTEVISALIFSGTKLAII